ncbi:PAS domain S-box protein [Desulfomonile tiedjei]|uniref:histidine kinase n=1 Tax=Desulfomonile tiedjei (strain ATCC 49306 / DSM 6799 / DCB-1) TaxID=706587 RepID=I4C061_DESTA|nr:PAS domain S-box protein [Desulfomonile tiedjei]AFM22952.1 PAS domain S-box [Desulfomonile tiedjei DSM 6799]
MTIPKFSGLLVLAVFAVALLVLATLDIRTVFALLFLAPFLSIIFGGILSIFIAYIAGKTYVNGGSYAVLFMGCGMLSLGLAVSIGSYLVTRVGGANDATTVQAAGFFFGSVFHAIGAILNASGRHPHYGKGKPLTVAAAYAGVTGIVVCVTLAALNDAILPFFDPSHGPSMLRQAVLGSSTVLYIVSCAFFFTHYLRSRSDFFYWYAVSLALSSIAMISFFFLRAIGSPIGWLGKCALYMSGLMALAAVFSSLKNARLRGVTLEEAIAGLFADAEAGYKMLVETATDAIITFDHSGRIIDWNSAAEKMFGYSKQEAIGASFFQLVNENRNAELQVTKEGESAFHSFRPGNIEVLLERDDGRRFPAEMAVSCRKGPVGLLGTCIIRDLTERKRAEAEVRDLNQALQRTVKQRTAALETARKQNELLQAVERAQTQFIADTDSETVFAHFLEDFCSLTASEFGFIGEIVENADGRLRLYHRAVVSNSCNEQSQQNNHQVDRTNGETREISGLWSSIDEAADPIVFNHPENNSQRIGLPEDHPPIRAFLGLPFLHNGRLIGMAGLANRADGYDSELVDFLQPYVMTCANIIKAYDNQNRRREAEQQLKKAHAELEQKVRERTAKLAREIEERKQTEQALLESRAKYKALYEDSADGILLFDDTGTVVDANKAILHMFGYSLEEIRGQHIEELIHPEDLKETPLKLQAILEGVLTRLDRRMRMKDGTYVACEVCGRHIGDNLNQALYRDITERQLAQEALRQNEELYRQMFHGCHAVKLLIDPDTADILDANAAASKFYGYELADLKKMKIVHVNVLSPSEIYAEIDKARAELKHFFLFEHKLASGEIRNVEVYTSTLNVRGRTLLSSIIHDVTNRVRAEADLIRSNKDLEQFAYVASHDLQEPLRNVVSALQMIEKLYKGRLDEESDTLIHYAVDSAKKMRSLIIDLLTYSRLNLGQLFERVDTQKVLEQSLHNLENLIYAKGTTVTYDEMPDVQGDATQLMQVFQNLIANAVKFGRTDSPQVHISAQKTGNEWIFSVQDNGIGVPKEYFDRIFVIFQQLNKQETFDGTGMGLAIVKRIVERHRGRIWVESEVEVGSTFFFSIPDGRTS